MMNRWSSRLRSGRISDAQVIRTSGLLDSAWYLERYPDVQALGMDAVEHYVKFGARERRLPNPYFDTSWYLEHNQDVARAGVNPLAHYVLRGAQEGRPAGPNFDTKAYLEANPDVRSAGMNPLRHFIRHGRLEGRAVARKITSRPPRPEWCAFTTLAQKRRGRAVSGVPVGASRVIDVIVPVYRGLDDTLACLHSVLLSTPRTPFELIVVDDVSPEPELSEALKNLASLELITLLVNEQNLGFVGTVNRGMARHPERDVVLLNSDTVVYNDWLDRLIAHAEDTGVATITPFSNNATICSYPQGNADNASLLEIEYGELDEIAAQRNRRQSIEVPTGVGFCFFIARRALDRVGDFDTERFGKGYGEENDFCMRAARAGMRNLMALDVFVRHTGQVSFGASSNEACLKAQAVIHDLYPDYHASIQAHLKRDPARPARRNLDIARLVRQVGAETSTLCFSHTLGGGVKRYLRDRARQGRDTGRGIIVASARSMSDRSYALGLNSIDEIELPNLAGALPEFLDSDAVELARALGVDAVEVHSLVGYPSTILEQIPRFAGRLGAGYSVMLHDYVPMCPQVNLIDASGLYCGEKGITQCRGCLAQRADPARMVHGPAPFAAGASHPLARGIDIEAWRNAYGTFLRAASNVMAPSRDTAQRYARYFPDVAVEVVPHGETIVPQPAASTRVDDDGRAVRVAIIGAIGPPKGSGVLLRLAEDARARHLPLHFVVVGYTDIDDQLRKLPNVTITGAYREQEAFDALARQRCHLALLPSVWPETYCYTFTIACEAGLPTVVFDLGAPAERAHDYHNAVVLPLALAGAPSELNERLLAIGGARVNQQTALSNVA